jgi:hypothetical protein
LAQPELIFVQPVTGFQVDSVHSIFELAIIYRLNGLDVSLPIAAIKAAADPSITIDLSSLT